jgi:hypothetical protein
VTDDPDPATDRRPTGETFMVPMIYLVACRHCRRARGAARAGARGPRPARIGEPGRCEHGKVVDLTVWAPGHGPGEGLPDPTTPQERRQGPV